MGEGRGGGGVGVRKGVKRKSSAYIFKIDITTVVLYTVGDLFPIVVSVMSTGL